MPVNMAAKGNPKEIRSYCSHAAAGGINQRGLGPWRRGSRVRRRARGARAAPPFAPARVRHSDAARPDSAAVADRAAQAGRGKQALPPSCCGVRSYEPEESERLARLGVRVYLMEEVRQRGLRRALDEALRIASQDTAGFGISIDLDVVTPEDAPGVAVPAEGGLGGAELARALEGIGGRPGLAAVELVEYCPRLDKGGRSAQVAVDLLAATLCGSRDDAQVVAEALDR